MLIFTFVFKLFTSLVAKLKEMKCSSESTESLTSRFKVFISSSVYVTIDHGTSSVVALRLVRLNFCLPFSGPCSEDFLAFSLSRAKEVFYASPTICSSFQNREEPLAHFEKRFCLFLVLQKAIMFFKTL